MATTTTTATFVPGTRGTGAPRPHHWAYVNTPNLPATAVLTLGPAGNGNPWPQGKPGWHLWALVQKQCAAKGAGGKTTVAAVLAAAAGTPAAYGPGGAARHLVWAYTFTTMHVQLLLVNGALFNPLAPMAVRVAATPNQQAAKAASKPKGKPKAAKAPAAPATPAPAPAAPAAPATPASAS